MTDFLSTEHNKWAELIEGSGEKCLLSAASAKSVEHVLSTATVRGPQKNLCTAVLPLVPKLMDNAHGVAILTSLVKYGTSKTAESVEKELVKADAATWSLSKSVAKELTSSLGGLLEAIVYREDCEGEPRTAIVKAMTSTAPEKLLSSAFTLPACGLLFTVDARFAGRIAADMKGKKALQSASLSPSEKKSAASFCEKILSTAAESAVHAMASKYLFEVFFASSSESDKRPREEVVRALAAAGSPEVVSRMAKTMQKWSNMRELLKRESYAFIFSDVIARADDVEAAKKVTLALFESVSEIDAMLASRKKPFLRLLASIDDKPAIVAALEKKLGTPLAGKLRGSKVRYTNATVPRATATQQAIMAKLEKLRQGTADAKATQKRPRE